MRQIDLARTRTQIDMRLEPDAHELGCQCGSDADRDGSQGGVRGDVFGHVCDGDVDGRT